MKRILLFTLILLPFVTGCAAPAASAAPLSTSDVNEITTMVYETMQALAAPTSDATLTPTPTETPTATVTPTPTLTSTPTKAPCPETNVSFELRVLDLINIERAKMNLPPLTYQSQLTAAALAHSADMACNNYFSHASPDGSGVAERVAQQGYASRYIGENIAAGYSTPEELVNGWMDSPDHRANILGSDYVEIGIGYASSRKSDYGSYLTAIFGSQ